MELNAMRQRTYIRGCNKFSLVLLTEVLRSRDDSFLLCPPLLSTSLVFIMSGSKRTTTREILNILQLPVHREEVEEAVKLLHSKLQANMEQHSLRISHQLYINKDFTVKPEFQKVAEEVHQAGIQNIDFNHSHFTTQTVNEWAKINSDHTVTDLLAIEEANCLTDALLVSVASFKAAWLRPFRLSETRRGMFFRLNNEVIEVEVMNSTGKYYRYYENQQLHAKFVEVPLIGEEASMILVLPHRSTGMSFLEKKMDMVIACCSDLSSELVHIALPRFKIRSKHLFKNLLQNVGLVTLFRDDEADLSGIADETGDLVISEIIQGVAIDVTEHGIGTTNQGSIIVPVTSNLSRQRRHPKSFIVDHPFFFLIRVHKLFLYAGKILEPEQ